jgi:hypothetical protein
MARSIGLLSIVSLALAALLATGDSRPGGRTLGLAEQQTIWGGQSGYCCGVPTYCQVPSPNPTCENTYKTPTDCNNSKYWANPAGKNLYDCVIVVPSAFCVVTTPYTGCLYYQICVWNYGNGTCFTADTMYYQGSSPQSCGDTGCT